MSNNTYGSYGLFSGSLIDIKENYIKKDTLYLPIYDYWTSFHNPNKRSFGWHDSTLSKLSGKSGLKICQTLKYFSKN